MKNANKWKIKKRTNIGVYRAVNDTYRELNDKEEPICVNCNTVDEAILYARKMHQA